MEPQDFIQQLYITYYGRPADPEGLAYWAQRLEDNGGNLGTVMDAFGNSVEFDTRFGGLGEQDLIDNLYQQAFGRDAEPEGLNYYADRLASGESSLIDLAQDIANGAQGDDITAIENRVEVSQAFTEQVTERGLNYGEIEAAGQLLAQVTANTNVNDYIQSAVNERLDTLAAEDGDGGSGSIGPTFSVTEEAGTLQFDGTATGAITFTLTDDTVTAERQGVTSELTTTTADLKGVNLPTDTEVKVESGTLTLTAAQANGRVIGGESAGSVLVTALADKADADLSNISVDTTLALAENDDFVFTGELNTDTDITAEMNGDNSVDLSSITANVGITLGAASAFDGSFASGDTVAVNGDYALDISALTDDDLPEGFTLASGTSLTLTPEQADGLPLMPEQPYGLTINGGGDVIITELDKATLEARDGLSSVLNLSGIMDGDGDTGTVSLDIDSTGDITFYPDSTLSIAGVTITGTGTVDAESVTISPVDRNETDGDFSDDTSPTFTVPEDATLRLSSSGTGEFTDDDDATNDWALSVKGAGTVTVDMPISFNDDPARSYANLSAIEMATTLTVAEDTIFTGRFNDAQAVTLESKLTDPADVDEVFDITGAFNLPASIVLDGVNLTATAAQLDGLSVTGASSVTVKDLDAMEPETADLTGIDVPLTLDLEGSSVDFEGQIDTADLTITGGASTLNVTDAAVFTAENVAVGSGSTLVMQGSQVGNVQGDGFSVASGGTVDLRGDVQAADFQGSGVGDDDGTVELSDADSLEGFAANILDVIGKAEGLSESDIDITVSPSVNLAQAGSLADINTEGEISYSVQDSLTQLLNAATSTDQTERDTLVGGEQLTIDDLDSGSDAQVTFGGLSEGAATSIDFTDDETTLSEAELVEINDAGLEVNAGDAITVTDVTTSNGDFTEAAVIDLLDDNDTIIVNGTTANDIIDATNQAADFELNGDTSDDELVGGEGDDFLTGGAGADQLTGGVGNDTFFYDGDSGVENGDLSGMDLITDFEAGDNSAGGTIDKLEIEIGFEPLASSVLTEKTVELNQSSILTDLANAFSGSSDSGNTEVQVITGDGNGDLTARSFLAVDVADDGVIDSNDLVIEVTGITGTFDANDISIT